MIRTLLPLLALGLLATSAQAYEIRSKSESSLYTSQELAERVRAIGDQVGHTIPTEDQVRVYVISESRPRVNSTEILYNHRVELRKLFDGREPPYPFAGWLVLHTAEWYGVGKPEEVTQELDNTIRRFFNELRGINPQTQAP